MNLLKSCYIEEITFIRIVEVIYENVRSVKNAYKTVHGSIVKELTISITRRSQQIGIGETTTWRI